MARKPVKKSVPEKRYDKQLVDIQGMDVIDVGDLDTAAVNVVTITDEDLMTLPIKSALPMLEHPFFPPVNNPLKKILRYNHNEVSITVTPSLMGLCPIRDKDILIFAASVLRDMKRNGLDMSTKKPLLFRGAQLMRFCNRIKSNRYAGGSDYNTLCEQLTRLRMSQVTTNIKTGGRQTSVGFGFIEWWGVTSEKGGYDSTLAIQLSDWLWRSIASDKELLTISRDYFKLSPLSRRIYEIARKHVGHGYHFHISAKLLHKKTGSTSSYSEFRRMLKDITRVGEYFVIFNTEKKRSGEDLVEFLRDPELIPLKKKTSRKTSTTEQPKLFHV